MNGASIGFILLDRVRGPFGVDLSATPTLEGPGPYYYFAELPCGSRPGDRVSVGPLRFRYVTYSVSNMADVLVLDNALARPRLWLWRARARAHDAYVKAILTLYVWGAADRWIGTVPTWRNVKALRAAGAVDWWPNGHAWQASGG